MHLLFNGRSAYAYFPHDTARIVTLEFSDGERFSIQSALLERMGYNLSQLPCGDKRGEE